jgi:hypothetical protein
MEELIKSLKACQTEQGYISCFECKHMFDCKLRYEYVEAVYNLLNPSNGGFEF